MPLDGQDNRIVAEPAAPLGVASTAGERLVFYEYCVSLIFLSLRRPSRVYRLRREETGFVQGLPHTVLSLLLGWWSIPWGLIYTPLTLWTNLTGGRELTPEEVARTGLGGSPE